MGLIVFLVILVVILLLVIIPGIFVVKQQQYVIIERLGKFKRIVAPGLHVRIPYFDRIAARIEMRTMQRDFTISAKTKDNVNINMRIAVQYKVNDQEQDGVYKSYYVLSNPVQQMESYIIDALRSAIPYHTLDEVYEKKDDIANTVKESVSQEMINCGYLVVNTLITAIALPPDVEESMNSINSSLREKEAAQNLADAERIKLVTEAKARAESDEQVGIGIARQRQAIAEGIAGSLEVIQKTGVSAEEANNLFMYTQWVDMMRDFSKNSNASTVVLPSDFKESSSVFEQMLVANKQALNDTFKDGN